ncbi:hypothetical protein PSTG_03324 [Puccinia striiformis f. sp. tritici PST-78]|uniref:RING-type domain-containing protein n=1 Tax=Puccinia striiformis f. sp. tritici PST-78 TaxID=1165861 RepID=A0A0L0VVS9_9BASI|nr:hypothetical protein PSTG_03324 [Puccinia striiformis f. sp. tritici PST-78]
MDQPNIPGEDHAGATDEPLDYLGAVVRSGAITRSGDNIQMFPYNYLEILVPIEDLIDTLNDRQQLLIMIYFLEVDTHIFSLRHTPQNQVPIEQPSDRLQAEADEALRALIMTDPQRYTDFYVELMNEYLTLLIHSEDPEDRLMGMEVLLQHLVNINGSELGSDDPTVDACSICQDDYTSADSIIVLPCHSSHHFHRRCIETWLHLHLDCPNCRAPVGIAQAPTRRAS